ncbi:hypothetical protein HHL17_01460 [Chitinophaga sp. G-6-1-13]|uniref:Uncharacterized protein n=1 Tax=Chitinophaga fulva TaxID=2728842 RepID=A0A848GDQ9_9BACT|nr:hypothetical protein [Chitinophaga fulva]NML35851.1 hypothetical protein [Chitinophaga fulva]
MDKLFSDELQYYIESARLKTARQKRRAVITARDKEILRLDKYRRALWRKSREPLYVPLKPPIQKGYERFFILRDDVARGKQASFFQEILVKINTVQYFHRKDFKKKKRLRGKKVWVDKEQSLRRLDLWEFDKLRFTQQEAAYFEVQQEVRKCGKKEVPVMVFKEPWRFILRVRPHMLTHQRIVDPVLESQIQEIDNYITSRQLEHRMCWLTQSHRNGWRSWQFDVKHKEKYKKKPLYQLVQEEYYDNID